MATPYRDLFAALGTAGLALAGLLARLPLPMTGIGIITLSVAACAAAMHWPVRCRPPSC
jgi:hypothetical protein